MLKKVAFTMYPVRDVARVRQLYEEALGLKVGLNGNHGDKWWIEYDLPGGGCVALTNFIPDEPSAAAGGTIAFEVFLKPDLSPAERVALVEGWPSRSDSH